MFRLLNNQLFGTCVNALTTDYEIRRNGPSPALYFSRLLDATLVYPGTIIAGGRHARTHWSTQGTRAVGRSVSRWYQISHAIQVRRFIHLGDAHSKQWSSGHR